MDPKRTAAMVSNRPRLCEKSRVIVQIGVYWEIRSVYCVRHYDHDHSVEILNAVSNKIVRRFSVI